MYICIYANRVLRAAAVQVREYIISLRRVTQVSNNQNDETLIQNSLRYLSKVNVPMALT